MKRILLTLLLLGSNGVSASDCTDTHLSLGEPLEASVVLCRDAYAVGFNYEYKSPLWASYRTTYEDSKFICDKDPDFRRDPDVDKEFQATDSDYANNDWDKGQGTYSTTSTNGYYLPV